MARFIGNAPGKEMVALEKEDGIYKTDHLVKLAYNQIKFFPEELIYYDVCISRSRYFYKKWHSWYIRPEFIKASTKATPNMKKKAEHFICSAHEIMAAKMYLKKANYL
jgi:hypothetical protein